ncbi:kanadaptin [Neodiprion fabricii]|uniref:kanadaptin n=1 Tax=Neodiprion fabricii TaxID=2872261 RepID=UPI001ED8E19D|nr:kanadaptin [Neodiprion fabricii]XP_046422208.1 kanadaptin [Neodiprion fabricii]
MDLIECEPLKNTTEVPINNVKMIAIEECLPPTQNLKESETEIALGISNEAKITAVEGSVKNHTTDPLLDNFRKINSMDIEGVQNIINVDQKIPADSSVDKKKLIFKTPSLLIGPRKGKPGKLCDLASISSVIPGVDKRLPEVSESMSNNEEESGNSIKTIDLAHDESKLKKPLSSAEIATEKQPVLPYKEPIWGGLPEKKYKLEVLKSGVILETIDLTLKSFYVLGRLPICDIPLAHPTISRFHAIIQYRLKGDEKNPIGLYLYDLGSTHGSFWNGHRMKLNMYVRIRSGHMIRFGCSQRKFIVHGPTEDEEDETELTVTELKENRRLELEERQRKEKEEQLRIEEEERLRKVKEENEGIDWGMGEDADEETDLSENPYAATNNEELFLDDPKKTLRGWFEREGFELQYQTEEKGIGQFLCWVDLPIDSITGKSVRAEALVKGKKKESVIQCALEACRILDRHGVLRQAHHEARKRKAKNWEEEDFYDSDEDNFLDRTGAIEKKRLQRMRSAGKLEDTVETYNSLLEKHKAVVKQITNIENDLRNAQWQKALEPESSDEDALDAFMSNLKTVALNKSEIVKMKIELQTLRKEENRLINLVNIAKPANLPPLKPQTSLESTDPENVQSAKSLPMIGSRKKFKVLKSGIKSVGSSLSITHKANEADEDDDKSENEKEVINARLIEAYKLNLTESCSLGDGESTETGSSILESDNRKESDENNEEQNRIDCSSEAKLLAKEDKSREEVDVQKRKRRNQKRIQQRLEKAEKDKQKGYEQDTYKEDYSMWVPPENQTGDGKTNLNDKFGY